MKKQILILALAVLCAMPAFATDFTVEGISYTTDDMSAGEVKVVKPNGSSQDLTSVVVPGSVKAIGANAMETVFVDERNTVYDSRNGCNAIIVSDSHTLMAGISTSTIPSSAKAIGAHAFNGCKVRKQNSRRECSSPAAFIVR